MPAAEEALLVAHAPRTAPPRGSPPPQVRAINCGDPSMSVLELWGAEYQENSAILLRPEHLKLFEEICEREKCPAAFLGQVSRGQWGRVGRRRRGRLRRVRELQMASPMDQAREAGQGQVDQRGGYKCAFRLYPPSVRPCRRAAALPRLYFATSPRRLFTPGPVPCR